MTVFLFNGPPRSGKDTAAKYVTQTNPLFKWHAFADNLKRLTHEFIGRPDLNLLSKDELDKIKDLPVQVPFFFAGITKANAEQGLITLRDWYIHVSEKIIKPTFGDGAFGIYLANEIKAKTPTYWDYHQTISDSGFQGEFEALADLLPQTDFVLIHIHRDGCDFSKDSRSYWNSGHRSLRKIVVIENDGSLSDFYMQLDRLTRWAV